MLEAASSLARDPDPVRAGVLATQDALSRLPGGRADAALVFSTGPLDLARCRAAAREVLGGAAFTAVVAHAVAAAEVEEEAPGAASVLALAGVESAAFAIADGAGAEESIAPEVESVLGRSLRDTDLVVVFADPFGMEPARLVAALGDLAPAVVVGAGAAADRPGEALLATSERSAFAGGACGLVLGLATPARIATSQGCRPFGELRTVTRTDGHWVLEIDGKPALEVFAEVAREPLAEDLRRAAERVLLAVPRDRGDAAWVARRVSGFAARRGAIAVSEPLRTGSVLRFALRDADLAREDLRQALDRVAPVRAALYLGASDRGRSLFQHAGLESAIVARALAPASVAGAFGSFEIAPLGGEPQGAGRATMALLAHAGVVVGLE